jgi:hypothetical protein
LPITKPEEVPPLIRRFEPVLHFHKDERFYPSDAKRYMEAAALWTVEGPDRTSKFNWSGSGPGGFPRRPRIARRSIAAQPDEPGTFVATTFASAQETFLDLAGWSDGTAVTTQSENRLAALAKIASLYGATAAPGTNATLSSSRFWYHAELITDLRLRDFTSETERLKAIADKLESDPAILLYYLFFPGSDGALQGCDTSLAPDFESHAGQWACVAILLTGTTPAQGGATSYRPYAVGLSCRSPQTIKLSNDGGIGGMTAFEWDLVTKAGPLGAPAEHPLIFVANRTHGLYRTPGAQSVQPPAPGDVAGSTCGHYETLAAEKAAGAASTAEHEKHDDIVLAKMLIAAGFYLNPVAGVIVGFYGALPEVGGTAGMWHVDPPDLLTPPQLDQAPATGDAGIIVHPAGVDPPDAGTATKISWPAVDNQTTLSSVLGGRTYSLMVSAGGNPFQRPPWLRIATSSSGFRGRWGNRVTQDPMTRRAGMAFPNFVAAFLFAFAQFKSI